MDAVCDEWPWMHVCPCRGAQVEVRGQLWRAGSLCSSLELWVPGLNSGCQANIARCYYPLTHLTSEGSKFQLTQTERNQALETPSKASVTNHVLRNKPPAGTVRYQPFHLQRLAKNGSHAQLPSPGQFLPAPHWIQPHHCSINWSYQGWKQQNNRLMSDHQIPAWEKGLFPLQPQPWQLPVQHHAMRNSFTILSSITALGSFRQDLDFDQSCFYNYMSELYSTQKTNLKPKV